MTMMMPLCSNKRSADREAESAPLYERDIVLWAESQARALRSRHFSDLDIEHVAEEIEDLSKRARSELRSRTRTVVEHLLKLRFSRAEAPRGGWVDTVDRFRAEIQDLLSDSPSLRPTFASVLEEIKGPAVRFASRSLYSAGEVREAAECERVGAEFDIEQVFGDWLPDRV